MGTLNIKIDEKKNNSWKIQIITGRDFKEKVIYGLTTMFEVEMMSCHIVDLPNNEFSVSLITENREKAEKLIENASRAFRKSSGLDNINYN